MNLRKKLAFGICLLFIVSSVAACSKTSDSAQSTSNNTKDSSTLYGKVTKIDGKKITLALGNMAQGNMGGTAPSGMPEGGNGGKSGGTAPSGMPKGGNGGKSGGTAPSGMPQGGNGGGPGGMGGFTESGETLVITIDDESLIKVQSGNQETSGSLDDISVGSILTIQYSDNNKISSVLVQSMNNPAKQDTTDKKSSSSSSK